MDNRLFDVAVVGELNPDLILSGNVIPEFGQVEKLVDQGELMIGSSSAIFACGAARLGLRVAFLGKVGNDLFGEFMRHSLEQNGIDTSGIIFDENKSTGISVILSKGQDRAILTYPGTIPWLEVGEIDPALIRLSRHLHVGSYFIQTALQPGLPRLFDQAHEWGLTTSLDTNYDPSGKWNGSLDPLLGKVDVFLPNARECMGIAGITELEPALEYLQKKVRYLAVKLGEDGALMCMDSKILRTQAIDVAMCDTVGAGDSFDAGFIYGYLAGWDPEQMLKFANICGGLSTRKAGGIAGQPTFEEASNYLKPSN
jgi:sugar/nucleoside kinase (ribokinase family)